MSEPSAYRICAIFWDLRLLDDFERLFKNSLELERMRVLHRQSIPCFLKSIIDV